MSHESRLSTYIILDNDSSKVFYLVDDNNHKLINEYTLETKLFLFINTLSKMAVMKFYTWPGNVWKSVKSYQKADGSIHFSLGSDKKTNDVTKRHKLIAFCKMIQFFIIFNVTASVKQVSLLYSMWWIHSHKRCQ